MESDYRRCSFCAHKEYCPLGSECVNENYLYFMSIEDVRYEGDNKS